MNGSTDLPPHFVVHLPIDADDLTEALRLAEAIAAGIGFIPNVVPGETTVSASGDESSRVRVFCDQRLPGDGNLRCVLRHGHDGDCGAWRGSVGGSERVLYRGGQSETPPQEERRRSRK